VQAQKPRDVRRKPRLRLGVRETDILWRGRWGWLERFVCRLTLRGAVATWSETPPPPWELNATVFTTPSPATVRKGIVVCAQGCLMPFFTPHVPLKARARLLRNSLYLPHVLCVSYLIKLLKGVYETHRTRPVVCNKQNVQ
jgi:hypothetical protein